MTFMDDNIFYPDACVISRSEGKVNASTGEEELTPLYSGKCGLNLNSTGDAALQGLEYKIAPKLIIPVYDVIFKVNDTATITLWTGRIIEGTIENHEACKYPGMQGTTIWMKLSE